MERRAKIVATIGPATQEENTLLALLQAGVDVVRLNFSHGSHQSHQQVFQRVRALSTRLKRPIAILQDLPGPKIRVGALENQAVTLQVGQRLTLTTQPIVGDARCLPVDYPDLARVVTPGGRVLLDDGNLELVVLGNDGERIETEVKVGGLLRERKGVNLPGAPLNLPALTAKDETDLAFGLSLGMDAVALSFVRTAQDVHLARQAIERLAARPSEVLLIAKLERPEALENLEAILAAADGVMVARGDLGIELSPEEVPVAQKEIIRQANRAARLVITATQMLESMVTSPRPTRAEASDVANAIFDGSDALMLSAETAIGRYPVQAVSTMDAIIRQAEAHLQEWGCPEIGAVLPEGESDLFYTARAAEALGRDRNVAALAAFTESGRTAQALSKQRPRVPILAFTPYEETYRRLSLFWGVTPYLVPHVESIEAMSRVVDQALLASGTLQAGQQVVIVCGYPVSARRPANLVLLHTIGQP